MKTKRFAVILAGCGNKDGAEIHESVLTLFSIDKAGHSYQCFAPDVPQVRVVNFLTNEVMAQERNVLVESARIARSQILPLSQYNTADFDGLVLPGGNGVAYNLCSFAVDGAAGMTVNPDVKQAVVTTHQASKPVGALCISPVIIAKLIPGVTLTFGPGEPVNAAAEDIIVDLKNKVVSTPCYMLSQSRISQIAQGIDKLILKMIALMT